MKEEIIFIKTKEFIPNSCIEKVEKEISMWKNIFNNDEFMNEVHNRTPQAEKKMIAAFQDIQERLKWCLDEIDSVNDNTKGMEE